VCAVASAPRASREDQEGRRLTVKKPLKDLKARKGVKGGARMKPGTGGFRPMD
jgi:hypothetical protein